MKRLLVIPALIATIATTTAFSQGTTAAPPVQEARKKFDPKADAAKDIADAIKLATKQNKRILLDVGGEWCGWCHKLDKFFVDHKEAAKILKDSYIVVKINFSQENENKEVLSKYPKINGYPHLFVLDKTGKIDSLARYGIARNRTKPRSSEGDPVPQKVGDSDGLNLRPFENRQPRLVPIVEESLKPRFR